MNAALLDCRQTKVARMEQILPGGRLFPAPDAVETQRRASRAVVQMLSTGSTVHREGLSTARTMAHANVGVAERVLCPEVACSHDGVEDRLDDLEDASHRLEVVEPVVNPVVAARDRRAEDLFGDLEDASHRLEDHFLTAMLSTSQLTADYAETFDDSVERTLRPKRADDGANSA